MGTTVEVRIETALDGQGHDRGDDGGELAEAVDATVVEELVRLERVFSAFDPTSGLSRWRTGSAPAGDELNDLLAMALGWQERTGGLFNPAAGELSALWRAAEAAGREPADERLAEVAAAIREPRYALVDGRATPIGDCASVDLNALAKGHIVDRAVALAMERHRPASLLVSAGGDLRVTGAVTHRIGVENPLRPYDNEPPLTVLRLDDGAVAGSGQARRGFTVAGRRFGHLLDPRTGRPVDGPAGVTVVAPDTATADVVATAAAVATTDGAGSAVDLVAPLDGVALLVVEADGRVVTDPTWSERFGPAPTTARRGRDRLRGG